MKAETQITSLIRGWNVVFTFKISLFSLLHLLSFVQPYQPMNQCKLSFDYIPPALAILCHLLSLLKVANSFIPSLFASLFQELLNLEQKYW